MTGRADAGMVIGSTQNAGTVMPLSQSDRLGPYEILGQVGAGGMGEVYQARDTRLNRIVAIKILSGGLPSDPVLGQRFRREAQALAALNHPNICTVHDVGVEPRYLVMEYLHGETLATRLSRGPLPIPEALEHAAAIADALDAAHRAGLVHRDVKPSNIILTEAGAKLVDFGLVRSASPFPGQGEGDALTTVPADLTAPGMVLGTLQYMAPEQVHGTEADARTDLFSFGAVLYEMVTGVKPFGGRNSFSLMASILEHDPPPMSARQPLSPAALDSLVAICLAKQPRDRWQNARDVTLQLERIAQTGAATVTGDRPAQSRDRLAWWIAAASVLALVVAGLWYLALAPSARPDEGIAFSIAPPEQSVTRMQLDPFTTVSPDGRHIAFTVQHEGDGGRLWVRSLDSPDARVLPGTEGAFIPFWSPDSLEIGFFTAAEGHIKAVPYVGGSVRVLCPAASPLGGTWNRDGTILFSTAATSEYQPTSVRTSGLHRVSAAGGEPTRVPLTVSTEPVTVSRRYGAREAWPSFLPDGHRFLYRDADSGTIVVGSLGSPDSTPLLKADSQAIYSATGHLLFVREGTLMGQPFDARLLQLQGEAFRIAENIRFDAEIGGAVFSVSDSGVLAYSSGVGHGPSRAVWMNRAGQVLGGPRDFGATVYHNRLFRDDNRLAQERVTSGEVSDIWLLDLTQGRTVRVTDSPADEEAPVVSPDGTEILYASNENGVYDLYRIPSTSSGPGELVYQSSQDKHPYDWSIHGRIAFSVFAEQTRRDIWLLDSIGSTEPRVAVRTTASEDQPRFSPDGRWLAYRSDRTGRHEIYIQPVMSGPPVAVSVDGGSKPFWRHDGRELFFVSSDGWMSAVDVRLEPHVEIGAPGRLFRIPPHCTHPRCFDAAVARDGRFFVATGGAVPDTPMRVLYNWMSVLKRDSASTR